MRLTNFLIISTIISIIPGQIIRINFFDQTAASTLTDVLVFLTLVSFLILTIPITKTLKVDPHVMTFFSLFSLFAASSTILSANNYASSQILVASLFLIRFILYFLFSLVVASTIRRQEITGWIKLILITAFLFILVGILQFVFIPDLTFLTTYGWDPHQRRIASSFIDPNFTGGFLSIIAAIAISYYLSNKKISYLIFSLLAFVAIILTFSRSSYLAFLTSLAVIGIVRSSRLFVGFLTIFVLATLFISQVRTRIVGALTYDETARSRVESWQKAVNIYWQNPIFGSGFNTYRWAQADLGYFDDDNPSGGHSGAGSDSSILFVAATTGTIGLSFYLLFLISIIRKFLSLSQKNPLRLGALSATLGLIVHSQFVNSLFFPQIMIIFWFILGLAIVYDS